MVILTYHAMGKEINTGTIRERMKQICILKGISANKLSLDLGMSRDYIRTIRENYSVDLLRKINGIYPDINLMWLITGDGPMVVDNNLEKMDFHKLMNLYLQECEKNNTLMEEKNELMQEVLKLKTEVVELMRKQLEKYESQATI